MKNITCYKGLGYHSFLTLGAITTYISAVMPLIKQALSLSYSQVGIIFAAKSTGFLIGALLSGVLVDRIGTKKPLLLSFIALPTGILLFSLSKGVFGLIAGNFLIGIGASFIEVAIPPISTALEGKSGKLLNLIHAFFALGAMISPLIASLLISKNLHYSAFLFVIAGYTCIPFYFSTRLTIHIPKKSKKTTGQTEPDNISLMKNIPFWIIITAIFFYVGSELGISSWASSYAADYRKYGMEVSSLLPSIFWIGLLAGRFVSSGLVDKIGQLKWLLIITGIGMPITFIAQLPPDSFPILALFICLSGLIHASIFPTLQSILVDKVKKNIGLALSLFAVSASVGSMAASFIIGNISTAFGINVGYFIPFIMFIGVFVMMMVFSSLSKKTSS